MDGLKSALQTPEPSYAGLGIERDGEFRQLNANLLQIENEYYSTIRPKCSDQSVRPVTALAEHGVDYVEVRTLDLDLEHPLGISAEPMRFLETLLVYCLLIDGPPIDDAEQAEIDRRELIVAWEGRRPGISLPRSDDSVPLNVWGRDIVHQLQPVADVLGGGDDRYLSTLNAARESFEDADRTPSARLLAELKQRGLSFFEYGLDRARSHRQHFVDRPLEPERLRELETIAEQSRAAQAELETTDQPEFGDYLRDYLAE